MYSLLVEMVNYPLSKKLLEQEESEELGQWIVVYDFIDLKPSPNFWRNLKRISTSQGGSLIQYSVYQSETWKETRAVRSLVNHYGGEVKVFRCFGGN